MTSRLMRSLAAAALFVGSAGIAHGQISFLSAVDLALHNSQKVKMAQADVARARAAVQQSRDVYIPSVGISGGEGRSQGVPLGLPVIFGISAQSLVFNYSQRDYIRGSRLGQQSAEFALHEARNEVAEDAANTYFALDAAEQRHAAVVQASQYASRLVTIVQERLDAGQDTHIELTRARRTVAQLHLQQLQIEDDLASLYDHMGRLTGLGDTRVETIHDSIPVLQSPNPLSSNTPDSDGIKAAFADASSKQSIAFGDARYLLRPQVSFSASYSRISTAFTNYNQYYPGFGGPGNSENAIGIGVQISIPIYDRGHADKARVTAAEAAHAIASAENQRDQFLEGRLKLQHSAREIAAKLDLVALDRELAQDQLDILLIQLQQGAGNGDGPQLTPKDEQNARLQERQRFIDFLDSDLQLHQTEVTLLRESGELEDWLRSAITAPQKTAIQPATGTLLQPAPQE